MLIASCGHEVTSTSDLVDVRYGDFDCQHDGFHPVVVYASYCRACANDLQASGKSINTDEQEQAWFNGAVEKVISDGSI